MLLVIKQVIVIKVLNHSRKEQQIHNVLQLDTKLVFLDNEMIILQLVLPRVIVIKTKMQLLLVQVLVKQIKDQMQLQ